MVVVGVFDGKWVVAVVVVVHISLITHA
jgi:hypothetical protein